MGSHGICRYVENPGDGEIGLKGVNREEDFFANYNAGRYEAVPSPLALLNMARRESIILFGEGKTEAVFLQHLQTLYRDGITARVKVDAGQ